MMKSLLTNAVAFPLLHYMQKYYPISHVPNPRIAMSQPEPRNPDLIWYKLPFCFFLCLFHFIIYYHFNSMFFVNRQYMLSKGNLLG